MSVAEIETAGHIVLYNVPWSTYETLLRDLDSRGTKLTYYRGTLEIMSPPMKHERLKRLFGRMIETLTLELDIPVLSGGSTTFRQELEEHGLEPDECYWIRNEPKIRGREEIDLDRDPPPDLVVEIEITSYVLNRLKIYAEQGVPEIWRYDGTELRVLRLTENGEYEETDDSHAFPFLPVAQLPVFLSRRNEVDETSWIRSFRDWVRELRPNS